MDREQYLLIKLAEECAELAQIALKSAQFGLQERWLDPVLNPLNLSNEDRLQAELVDVRAVIHLLFEESHIKLPSVKNVLDEHDKKVANLNKYYNISVNLGRCS